MRGTGFGNDSDGISIVAPDQIIGGLEPGAGNIIAFNGGAGVSVGSRANNQLIEGKSIFGKGGPGAAGGSLSFASN